VLNSFFNEKEYWRKRAQELRALAVKLSSNSAREQLLEMAEEYEGLAKATPEPAKTAEPRGAEKGTEKKDPKDREVD
jgi:hypothetical protein